MQAPAIELEALLPAGYQARPATLEEADAIAALLNAASQALLGINQHKAEEWRIDMQAPDYHIDTDTRVVEAPDGTLAGYANVWDFAPHVTPEQWGRVHPEHTGRSLGTYLLAWAEARTRQAVDKAPAGTRVAAQSFINKLDSRAHALLAGAGHQAVRQNVRMVIELAAPPPAPEWPEGLRGRSFVRGQDEYALAYAVREAFRDHWGFVEEPMDQALKHWEHWMSNDPDFDPALWFLAVDENDQVVGTSLARFKMNEDPELSWIHSLGVLRPWRRKGVALAMLRHSFVELYARGRRKVGLGVDAESLTGATRLYEKAGMRRDPRHHYELWEKELRAGTSMQTEVIE